jgi:orotate phosphoribosyltransferase
VTESSLLRQLEERGGVLRGHVQLASGRHSDTYIEKFRILQWPDLTEPLCQDIASHYRGQAAIVAGPTTGGIILAYETARQMGTPAYIAERRENGPGREFKRGFVLNEGDRVLIVDDILTTGGSIREVIDAVRAAGATPIGVGVLVDRSGGAVDFGLPLFACITLDVKTYEPADCPLCRDSVPLVVT